MHTRRPPESHFASGSEAEIRPLYDVPALHESAVLVHCVGALFAQSTSPDIHMGHVPEEGQDLRQELRLENIPLKTKMCSARELIIINLFKPIPL